MSRDPIAEQYKRWVYPAPIDDIAEWSRSGVRQAGDPRHLGYELWPQQGYRDGLRILVAGCGPNQAAAIAYNNPEARVVGIDVSDTSLDHERKLKSRHQLDNLEVRELPVEKVAALDEQFDLIISTGVLHHLEDPVAGTRALAGVLDIEGVAFIMLYARYGRAGAYILQDFFRRLGLDQTEEDVALVRSALDALNPGHPAWATGDQSPDHEHDGGLVDLYLNRRDVSYTVEDCLALLEKSGLVLQNWYMRSHYYPEGHVPASSPLSARLEALPEPQLWAAMELFGGNVTKHAFMACRPDRPASSWRVRIEPDTVADLIPLLRPDVTLRPPSGDQSATIQRQGGNPVTLNQAQIALLAQLDGRRNVAECMKAGKLSGDPAMLQGFAAKLVRSLWRTDYLTLRLPD